MKNIFKVIHKNTAILLLLFTISCFMPQMSICAKEQDAVQAEENEIQEETTVQTKENAEDLINQIAVTTETTEVYKKPNTEADKVGSLEKDEQVFVMSKADENWYQVYYEYDIAFIQIEKLQQQEVNAAVTEELKKRSEELEKIAASEGKSSKNAAFIMAGMVAVLFVVGIVVILKPKKTEDKGETGDEADHSDSLL